MHWGLTSFTVYSNRVPLARFMSFLFTHMPGKSYCRQFRSLLLCLLVVFWELSNSSVGFIFCELSVRDWFLTSSSQKRSFWCVLMTDVVHSIIFSKYLFVYLQVAVCRRCSLSTQHLCQRLLCWTICRRSMRQSCIRCSTPQIRYIHTMLYAPDEVHLLFSCSSVQTSSSCSSVQTSSCLLPLRYKLALAFFLFCTN